MLRLLKKISPSHEELFIEYYDRLMGWSLRLTEHDRDLAEDLLHDAFIHFTTLTQPDLKTIRNLDGYFYVMLRNCHYACARKEKAKLASVLILRFFHGYYPSEIAQILRSPRAAIDKWLQLARAEAKLALSDAEVLRFKDEVPAVEFISASFARSVEDLLSELRQTIFRTRQGDCFDLGHVAEIYQNKETPPLNCERLSHIVSCPQCLDEVNHMLKLPPLSERYPTDSIGKDTSTKGGGGGAGGEGGSGIGGREVAKKAVRKYRRDAREAFEHHPSELCVSVNGYIQGSHKISSELSEFDLSANLADEIS